MYAAILLLMSVGQCPGGQCQRPIIEQPVRTVVGAVEKAATKTVQPVKTTTKKVVSRRPLRRWRIWR